MTRYFAILIVFWASFTLAAENLSPQDVGATPLWEYSPSDEIISKAISATKEFFEKEGENISDFYIDEISTNPNGELVTPLWHKVAFTMPIYPGNPGGKNRNIIYSKESNTILRQEWWQ